MAMKTAVDIKSPIDSISFIRRFEKRLAKFQKAKYAFSTNSATSGLYLSALSLGLKAGDKIITSPISWPQTYLPFCFLGCEFLVVDYMKKYPIINPSELELVLKNHPDAKAVLIPILFGIADGVKEISAVCRCFNVPLLIDASQAFFSLISKKPLGAYGDIVVFSFSNFKDYGYGEGGAIVTNNADIFDRLHLLTSHPIRIHSDVNDLEQMIDNLDGFNFNFRMHPSTAIKIIEVMKNPFNNSINLHTNKLKILKSPNNLSKCSNKDYWIIDRKMNRDSIENINNANINYLIYPFLVDLFRKRNGKMFFWLDNQFRVTTLSDLTNARYWKENLILIQKGDD